MKSAALGKNISGAEVTNLSRHGFWLLLADEELFVPFKEFPWFQDASVSEIMNVRWPDPNYLYWPDLGMELAVESIQSFPLTATASRTAAPLVGAR